jgi:two-component system CheB/CheR fusion protein
MESGMTEKPRRVKTAHKKASTETIPLNPAVKSEQVPSPRKALSTFPIVGIGASAGGLEAFESFFKAMPDNSGMAFVLVAHLDPTHVSLLPELLQKATKMPVCHIQDGILLMPNSVYVIPPNKELQIRAGSLYLKDLSQPRGSNMPIDSFFRSLAEDQRSNAVGIILSGTGTDGTLGLKAIKGEVGMVMVQDERSAKYDGMPRSAIGTGLVDFILPTSEMPNQLIKYVKSATHTKSTRLASTQEGIPGALQEILIILRNRTEHDFSLYKMNTICRRIERRMHLHHIEEIGDYVRYLQESDREANILFKELLIGVTNFFRDPEAFEALKNALSKLLESKPDNYTVRVWVAGCSSGEEAYSVAILLRECMDDIQHHFNIQIFGTDIDQQAVAVARVGVYPPSILADLGPERLKRHFIKADESQYRINKSIREMLVFAHQNIIKDPPFTKLDLLCCRNLLIYLGPELQGKLLPMFHYSLNPDGLLFLGSSESIHQKTDLFVPENKKWKIFRRKATSSNLPPRFNLPASHQGSEAIGTRKIVRAEELSALQLIETILNESDTPPCAIIDDTCNIIYIHGRTGRYLEPAEGKASANILEMARPGLKEVLATTVRKVATRKKEVSCTDLRVKLNGGFLNLDLTVKPVFGQGIIKGLMMVIFQELKAVAEGETAKKSRTPDKQGNKTLTELELELQYNRENLQSTIEELETSNEELKSTNEELQSTNEELQSTNEELETSKEELQSLNEESTTVNAELHSHIEQLSKANDDMKNLLDSTEIATIFLDVDLCIRRFTPKSTSIIPLTGLDTGRPLKHFASTLIDVDLTKIAQQVLDDLAVKQAEVQTDDGHSYQMRLRPYRTMSNVIDGVVVTFDDVTERKLAETDRRVQSDLLKHILNNLPDPMAVMGTNYAYTLANKYFCQLIDKSEEEIVDRTDFDLFSRRDAERYRKIETDVVQNSQEQSVIEEFTGAEGTQRLQITRTPIYDETTGEVTKILVSLRKLAEEQP